jgi:mechanosensitive ion channel protein 1/2/3
VCSGPQVYRPLEFLFVIAAFTTLAENFLPQLIALPRVRAPSSCVIPTARAVFARLVTLLTHGMALQATVQMVVRSTLSLTFVIAAARVVFNIKSRMTREAAWQLELKGDLTKQRRVEAVDKLLSVLVLLVSSVFGLQAIGLDGG